MQPSRRVLVCLLLCTACSASAATAPETVSGRVYLDANTNGVPDAGEKGLAGVRVSDGMHIVETAADGTYTITIAADAAVPYRPAQCVAVNWPSYTWPVGRWWRRLNEVREGERVDFGLREDRQDLPYCFIHVSDNHDSGGVYPVFAQDVKRMLPMARFIINTGDLSYAATNTADDIFGSVVEKSKSLPVPILHTIGNHDKSPGKLGEGPGEHPLAGYGGYTKHLGPPRWSFDYAGAHFVAIDWEGNPGPWYGEDMKRVKPGTTVFGFTHYRGGLHGANFIFYGHVHVHEHKAPNVISVINLSGNGGCALGIVHTNGVDIVDRCSGCKADPTYHSRGRCQLRQLTYTLIPSLQPRRQAPQTVTDAALAPSSPKTLQFTPGKALELAVTLAPGSSRRTGVRIGKDKILEVAIQGDILHVAGVPIPFMPREQLKDLDFHLVVEKDRFTLYANELIHFSKAFACDAGTAALFADGGEAVVKKLEAWELQ